jgi:hypothetical protein
MLASILFLFFAPGENGVAAAMILLRCDRILAIGLAAVMPSVELRPASRGSLPAFLALATGQKAAPLSRRDCAHWHM